MHLPVTVKDKSALDLSRNVKLVLCFLGLQLSFVTWGVVQEQVMTTEYKLGKFKSSTFLVFGNRFLALFLALSIVLYKKYTSTKPLKEAPFTSFAPFSLSNSMSSWAQYDSLKYVSFPTQVLSKSCKIIPVMLVGVLINKKTYSLLEYAEAVLITCGVAIFNFSESGNKSKGAHEDSIYGIFLLIFYLFCDSFTSQWQSKVYKKYEIDQYQMMLGGNVWSLLLTGISLIYTGEGVYSIAFISQDTSALTHMFILSIASAFGQIIIYYTIKEFGPVIFTIMMTTRQIISLVISCVAFSHSLTLAGWIGSILVFAVAFYRIKRGSD